MTLSDASQGCAWISTGIWPLPVVPGVKDAGNSASPLMASRSARRREDIIGEQPFGNGPVAKMEI